ncbi:MAG TPA: hypothetical protein VMG10_16585 [Gemmataceae bacterium]|nr:hypothetical protein [Gemmataceae bacterium]
MRRAWQAVLLAMVCWAVSVSLQAAAPRDSLVGEWKHTSGKVGLTIDGTRLHFTYKGIGPIYGQESGFSLHADYSTRDQLIFGIITRVEAESIARHV